MKYTLTLLIALAALAAPFVFLLMGVEAKTLQAQTVCMLATLASGFFLLRVQNWILKKI